MHKEDDEYILMDRIVAVIDDFATQSENRMQRIDEQIDKQLSQYTSDEEGHVKDPEEIPQDVYRKRLQKTLQDDFSVFRDGFEMQANIIKKHIRDKGFATKGQLKFLVEYNKFD